MRPQTLEFTNRYPGSSQDICLWGERKNDAETMFNPAKTGISFQQWGMTHQKLGFDNKHGELVA